MLLASQRGSERKWIRFSLAVIDRLLLQITGDFPRYVYDRFPPITDIHPLLCASMKYSKATIQIGVRAYLCRLGFLRAFVHPTSKYHIWLAARKTRAADNRLTESTNSENVDFNKQRQVNKSVTIIVDTISANFLWCRAKFKSINPYRMIIALSFIIWSI